MTCLSVSTDGSVLLSGSHDETVRLWDVQSKQCIRTVALRGGWPRVGPQAGGRGLRASGLRGLWAWPAQASGPGFVGLTAGDLQAL